jgi:hypothetical protein
MSKKQDKKGKKVELTKGDGSNISAKDTSAGPLPSDDFRSSAKAEKPERPKLEATVDPGKLIDEAEADKEEEKDPDEPYDPLKHMTKEQRAQYFKAKANVN